MQDAAPVRPAPPDPWTEIRVLALSTVPGINFWSRRPVTRLDLHPGAFDEISSADVEGTTERLVRAIPGLREHRCSIGERGGFVTRLRRGTYAPHIAEHVALELQAMIGHPVGFGRARGGDGPGEYTVVIAHQHAAVGCAAAEQAVEVVRRAFAGTLEDVAQILETLRAAAMEPDAPRPEERVAIAATGGALRPAVVRELARRAPGVEVGCQSPREILAAGLSCAEARVAVVADGDVGDVPERYRDEERARQLLSVVADAVPAGGIVVIPAGEWEMERELRDRGWRVALFTDQPEVDRRDARLAHAVATVRNGCIQLECAGDRCPDQPLVDGAPPAAQAAAALALRMLQEDQP